jgi:AcrR family transcriptional regulator
MSLRHERKLATRRALLDAALSLMAEGSSFGALSLREVARVAQVVPTAFYRHFRDMDELGLVLADETFHALRRLLREARQTTRDTGDLATESVRVYLKQVRAHRQVFEFIVRERHGGTPAVRAALARDERFIMIELADDLGAMPAMAHLDREEREVVAHLIASAMASFTAEVLDVPAGAGAQTTEAALAERTVAELLLIVRGAASWKTSAAG